MMQEFHLRGLAEGMVGRSIVLAKSIDDVFVRFPALIDVRAKLTVFGNTISGFCACDG